MVTCDFLNSRSCRTRFYAFNLPNSSLCLHIAIKTSQFILQSARVSDAVYNSNWYMRMPAERRLLWFMKLRSDRPVGITAVKFFFVNRSTFAEVSTGRSITKDLVLIVHRIFCRPWKRLFHFSLLCGGSTEKSSCCKFHHESSNDVLDKTLALSIVSHYFCSNSYIWNARVKLISLIWLHKVEIV